MCGICGVLRLDGSPVPLETLEAMNSRIVHRGPDDEGFFTHGPVGLAMRRLAIIDLTTGHQPLSNEDGSIWVVFNGEIYNHQELRRELQDRGHRYKTQSDTETLVHLYEEYGRDLVQHLRGMFAFVVWDERTSQLLAARDRLGIKPFYYHLSDNAFIFGSEIKAILAHPRVRAALNLRCLPEYLAFGRTAGQETLFEGIRKLPPGHTLEIGHQRPVSIERYWDLPSRAGDDGRPARYYIQGYRDRLEDAVRSHLMSDVPLGMFLSGGVDSSVIAALMTRIRKQPIETFSVGYAEGSYSELPYAREVARHIGSRHHEVQVSRHDFFRALPGLIWHEDEPLMGTPSIPLYFVARLASEHVKVVLTGEGSDETLAGYGRYPWTALNVAMGEWYDRLVPAGLRCAIRRQLADGEWVGATLRRKLLHTFIGRDRSQWESFYFDNFYSAIAAEEQRRLLSAELVPSVNDTYADSMRLFERGSGTLIDKLLYTDIHSFLVELLMKQDQMSMAASVESRVPFLDHPLAEFAAQIPARYKIKGMTGKWILKQAVRDLLPESIISRKKMGFPTPFASWLRGAELDRIEGLLCEPRTEARGLFRNEAVRRIFAEQRRNVRSNHDRIWRLLNLEIWQRVFTDGDPRPPMLASRVGDPPSGSSDGMERRVRGRKVVSVSGRADGGGTKPPASAG